MPTPITWRSDDKRIPPPHRLVIIHAGGRDWFVNLHRPSFVRDNGTTKAHYRYEAFAYTEFVGSCGMGGKQAEIVDPRTVNPRVVKSKVIAADWFGIVVTDAPLEFKYEKQS